ncbi:MAG: ABC transporter permease [Pseudomonadota bacterium]
MQELFQAFVLATRLVSDLDPELTEIILLSLRVSLIAIGLASLIGLPIGALTAIGRFPGKRSLEVLLNAMMGLPPVVVGLVVYLFLSRSGPLGFLGLLYTPGAMIVAQTILITPIVAALSREVLSQMHSEYEETFRALNVPRVTAVKALLWDGRFYLVTVALAGFGRAIAEVGAVMIVGGNIDHVTRVMTTAITLETSRGNLALAMALGIILVFLAISINALVYLFRQRGVRLATI